MTVGLARNEVELHEYAFEWREAFEQEKKMLNTAFKGRIIAIEHIGSTSIPGMEAKPIIDMNMAVQSLDDIDDFVRELPKLGYEYMPERRFSDRQFFPKGSRECRTHHLNLVEITSKSGWYDPILFRNYLRENDTARDEYIQLKQGLANKFAGDRKRYTEAKHMFIQDILRKARVVFPDISNNS